MAVASNGDVYVTIEGTRPPAQKQASGAAKAAPQPASFVALRDTNHDGRADVIKRIGSLGNTGVALANGFLYVDEGKQIVRYARSDTALAPEREARGRRAAASRWTADIARATSPSAATARSTSTSARRRTAASRRIARNESPGIDPCTELETRAGIWKYDANKTGQGFSPKERFATGIRNGMGIAFAPDGKVYATQHGRDQLTQNWPKIFPTAQVLGGEPGRGAAAGQPGRRLRLAILLLRRG